MGREHNRLAIGYGNFGGGCDVVTTPNGGDPIPLKHKQVCRPMLPQRKRKM